MRLKASRKRREPWCVLRGGRSGDGGAHRHDAEAVAGGGLALVDAGLVGGSPGGPVGVLAGSVDGLLVLVGDVVLDLLDCSFVKESRSVQHECIFPFYWEDLKDDFLLDPGCYPHASI